MHHLIDAVGDPKATRVVGRSYAQSHNRREDLQVLRRVQRRFQTWLGKTIEPLSGSDPDIPFAIGQQGTHSSRGQSIRVRVGIRDTLKMESGPHSRLCGGMGDAAQTAQRFPQRTIVIENGPHR